MKVYVKSAADTSNKWVIVNKDEKNKNWGLRSSYNELFIGAQKSDGFYYPQFTSASRNNYGRVKLFNSKEEAETFIENDKKSKNLFRYTPVEILPYDEAMTVIGDPEEAQNNYKAKQAEKKKQDAEAYRTRYKKQHANDKTKNPGKYKVWFYYANSWLGAESFIVNAESIDDAFKKAKEKALRQDPYRNASGYDERMIFNKNNIKKIED